jgi:SAM-dependent methyltransferase
MKDQSQGYEAIADRFIFERAKSNIGLDIVQTWAKSFQKRGSILDLGCGNGLPISQIFVEFGFDVYGVDASTAMVSAFCQNFPKAHARCEGVENSSFFDREFDGVIAWGLMFLLPVETQLLTIQKVAKSLLPNGRFLFTSPYQICEWKDVLSGLTSYSLGAEAYKSALSSVGMRLLANYSDEGENHYYDAIKL